MPNNCRTAAARALIGFAWLIEALSHLQPLGPALLAVLEFALAALEPTGLPPAACLETFSLLNGFVANLVRAEIAGRQAAAPGPAGATAQQARLGALLATGRYPRFAAALAAGGPPATDLTDHFDRLFDRIMDGLVRPAATTPEPPSATTPEPPSASAAEPPAASAAEPPAASAAEPPAASAADPPGAG